MGSIFCFLLGGVVTIAATPLDPRSSHRDFLSANAPSLRLSLKTQGPVRMFVADPTVAVFP